MTFYQYLECLCQMHHHHCCISFGSKIHRTLYLSVLLITASGVQAGGSPLKESVGGLTSFRFHLSKFLTAVGSIFQLFCPLDVQVLKFTSVLSQICFICLL